MLPKAYAWLAQEPGPRILREFVKVHGVAEVPGPGNSQTILGWAKATGLDRVYKSDATAWCGLAMAYVALEAGWQPPVNPLGARNWLAFGNAAPVPMLGDVLIFWRGSPNGWQGHVGEYVGEDRDCFHVIGGNQKNRVSIARIEKRRLLEARRCPWRIAQPANVRRVHLAASGAVSSNEA